MNFKKISFYFFVIITIVIFIIYTHHSTINLTVNASQNALSYLNKKTAKKLLVSPEEQHKLFQRYLKKYYAPWHMTNQQYIALASKIKKSMEDDIKKFIKAPGYGENKQAITQKQLQVIVSNIDIKHITNENKPAITISQAPLRVLPTNRPIFSEVDKPGNFYPFDNLQDEILPANQPVRIIQHSKDYAWDYVSVNGLSGWVSSNQLATVSNTFIHDWQQNNAGYISFTNDNQAIIDSAKQFYFYGRMGGIHPITQKTDQQVTIKVAVKHQNNQASIKKISLPRKQVWILPVPLTSYNVAKLMNQFIGMPYGWGGLYGYRDCSLTVSDVYAYFGIWLLPRSTEQAKSGRVINLHNQSNANKEEVLRQHGIAFLTLVHLDGHIMIYIGEQAGKLYVFHDMWGLKTWRLAQHSGRALVAKTVITPIDLGHHVWLVKHTLLDHVNSINTLIK